MTLVTNDPLHAKRVHEEPEGNMASRPLLEPKLFRQHSKAREDDYGLCSILEEMTDSMQPPKMAIVAPSYLFDFKIFWFSLLNSDFIFMSINSLIFQKCNILVGWNNSR